MIAAVGRHQRRCEADAIRSRQIMLGWHRVKAFQTSKQDLITRLLVTIFEDE